MQSWQSFIEKCSGEYYIYCKHIENGRVLALHENTQLETASVIKLPILLALLTKVQNGELSLRQPVAVHPQDIGMNGSGVMQDFYLHRPFELYNLIVLMMSISDNVSTNAIIRLLGKDSVNQYIRQQSFTLTELMTSKLDFPHGFSLKTGEKVGLTTPKEIAGIIEQLITGKLLNKFNTKLAMRLMRSVQTGNFRKLLPRKNIKEVGSKTGTLTDDNEPRCLRNEVGYIIDTSGNTYIFAVFSKQPLQPQFLDPYNAANAEISGLATQLYDNLRDY